MKLKPQRFTTAEIATVENRFRISTHPKQRDFVFDPGRFIAVVTGRGTGKTMALIMRIILTMMRGDKTTGRGANCLFVAKNREQARQNVWNDLKDVIDRLGLTGRIKYDDVRCECTMSNGSMLKLLGFDERDEIEKPRGKTWHEVAIDEAGSAKKELLDRLIYEVIGPRLAGAVVLAGTPGYQLLGRFFEATQPGYKIDDKFVSRPYAERNEPQWVGFQGWSSHFWGAKDGADAGIEPIRVIYETQLADKIKNGWSDQNPKWLREALGRWAQDDTFNVYVYRSEKDGAEWNQWTPVLAATDATRWARLPPAFNPKTWGYAIAMDVGFKDAFALEAFAYSYEDASRTIWHIGEFYKTRQGSTEVAAMLLGRGTVDKPQGIIGELGWPDFMIVDGAGQGAYFEKSMREDHGLPVKIVDKHPKYKDPLIETLNADLFEGRIKIMAGSNLAKELLELQWSFDETGYRYENPKQPNHACFVAGTMIMTARGEVPIERVSVGDLVWTRSGLREALASECTGERETMTIEIGGRSVTATGDHPFFTSTGKKELRRLTHDDMCIIWESTDQVSNWYGEASLIDDIQRVQIDRFGSTGRHSMDTGSIATSGYFIEAQSPTDGTSITRTKTNSITEFQTSNACLRSSTPPSIGAASAHRPPLRGSTACEISQSHGTALQMASSGIANTDAPLLRNSPSAPESTASARCAEKLSWPENRPSDVLRIVTPRLADSAESTISTRLARHAEKYSALIDTRRTKTALRPAGALTAGKRELVYNLTVDGEHEYFANGVLVSNCDALLYFRQGVARFLPNYTPGAEPTEMVGAPSPRNAPPKQPEPEESDGWTKEEESHWGGGDGESWLDA